MDIDSAMPDELCTDVDIDADETPQEVDDEEGGDDDDEDGGDLDAALGKPKQFVDGYINRPLPAEQMLRLQAIHKELGRMLMQLLVYLRKFKADDFQCFVDLSMV
jgi:hypothetical protein